jgi:hypothetical protein
LANGGVVVSTHNDNGARGTAAAGFFRFGVHRGREKEGMKGRASGGRRGGLEAHMT